MTANNCDDTFQQLQDLQRQRDELQRDLEEKERLLKLAGIHQPLPAGEKVILRDINGSPVELDPNEIQRAYQQLAGTMTSREVDQIISRGLDQRVRPVGSEGRFQNYDRLIREVDVQTRDDYARLAEALGITHERSAPEDFTFITQKYDKKKLIELVGNYYRELGANPNDADILARAAAKSAPAINAVENKLWLRFWADRSKRAYLDAAEQLRDQMKALPGAKPPPELQLEAYKQFRLALVLERHNNLVTRRHAQALRSQQENILDLEQFRLDLGDELQQGVDDAIGMKPSDFGKDEHWGKVLEAIDNNDAKQLDLLIDTAKIDGLDPKSGLDKDWFNTHMRMATALVKDSQLGNLNSQYLNLGSNPVMALFGPLQQTFSNGVKLTPIGTQMSRNRVLEGGSSLMEAWRITGQAHNYAWTTVRATWQRDLRRVFQEGDSFYSGNLDTYGKRLLSNQQELADMQAILDMPYRPGANWAMRLGNPHNMGLLTNKLQAAARILAFTKPGAFKATEWDNRFMAAWQATGLGSRADARQQLRVQDLDMYLPWKPALRAMAGVDEVFGKYHYLFKLKADLEVQARMEGAQLGLFDDRSRAEWVQSRIDEAVYGATPSESDIKAFRKQNGLKGSDFTDDEIGAMLAERNLAGAPTLATPESVQAMEYSAGMRFQNAPTGNPGEALDRATMGLRKNWMVDRYLFPYWRSPFMGFLLDHRLATFGAIDTLKMLHAGKDAPPELVARVKASWVMSGTLLSLFGVLDAAGHVGGGTDPDPDRRNTLFGMRLGGFPVMNTLFLWKDIKDTAIGAMTNDYDGEVLSTSIMKLLTAQLFRQTGVQQLQILVEAMLDGKRTGGERIRALVGFMGASQIPFIGAIRNTERALGMDRNSFYRDEPSTAAEQYRLQPDDPQAQAEQFLRNWLIDTLPLAAGLAGTPRKDRDHLGTPRGHINGVNLARAFPFAFPSVWPKGKVNEVVYAELDAQNLLDPPDPLLDRRLEGVAMSDDLQKLYNDIHGAIKADPQYPPTARLGLTGKNAMAVFPQTFEATTPSGQRIRETNASAKLPLAPLLDRVTRGRTKKEAFYALFTSPEYQQLQANPVTSSNPPGGLPPSVRKRKVAQQLIQNITNYYDLLTQDELERRAASGNAVARNWSETKNRLTDAVNQQGLQELQQLAPILSGGNPPAQ